MEERNLELDDDGKIKLKKNREDFLSDAAEDAGDDIVIEVPDFEGFREENGRVGLSDEELAAKAQEREERTAARKGTAEKLLEEADSLFEAGDLIGAGEKYLDSAAEYAADWRPWFGVVRVQTRDFTDFSEIYDCERAYERALRLMPKEERAALAQKYAPLLEGQAAAAEEEAAELTQKDISAREEARPALEREHTSALIRMIVFLALFAASAVAGGVLANLVLRTSRAERSLYLWMGVLTNTGFIGFAVLESIFGGPSVFLGSIFIAISNVFLYSLGVAVLRSGGARGDGSTVNVPCRRRTIDVRGMLRDMVNVPLVASLIAMVIFFARVPIPVPIMQAASMAGGVTSPLAMMLVGLSIADANLGAVLGQPRLWGFTLIRFLAVPLAVYVLLAPVVPSALALGVFVVMLAMPTGSMAGPIAATYGQDGELPAQGTIVSTIASFAIVPALITVMNLG